MYRGGGLRNNKTIYNCDNCTRGAGNVTRTLDVLVSGGKITEITAPVARSIAATILFNKYVLQFNELAVVFVNCI